MLFHLYIHASKTECSQQPLPMNKRKPRFTKITIKDKLILTLIYRHEYRSMDSVANEYEVSRDTIADNVHWVEQTLLNADLLETSVTCVYKTN